MSEPASNLLHTLSSKLPYLAPALKQIAELVLADPGAARSMSIAELATAAGVAESTVSRFVRDIGLTSFRALQAGIAEATFAHRAADPDDRRFVFEGIGRDDSPASIVGKIERSSQDALHQTAVRLNSEALLQAVDLIDQADVLVFFAMGSSSIAAEEGVMRFTRAGKKCMLFRDQSIQVMSATVLGRSDVVIAVSDSGQSTAIVDGLRLARGHGASTIAVTASTGSPLLEQAQVVLYTGELPASGGLYGESVMSKWGQLLAIDVLYATYASRHFDRTLEHLQETYEVSIRQSRRV